MSVRNRLRSALLRTLFSERVQKAKRGMTELKRKLGGSAHVVEVFLQIDDPYSYLLAHYLPALEECYDIKLILHLSQALGDGYQPAPDMLAEYAVEDSKRLARELGLPFLDKGVSPPTEHRVALTDAVAARQEDLLAVLEMYWRGDSETAARHAADLPDPGMGDSAIATAQRRLVKLGHYNSAMLYYGGEWYWGVDRLHYLLDRLDGLGARRSEAQHPKLAAIERATQVSPPVRPPAAAKNLPPLELFVSLRSPYSVLSLQRVFDLVDAFGLQLNIRLVFPMVMRKMQVPKAKLLYIVFDAFREARRYGIRFGKFGADPVGAGIERTYAVYHYACTEHRERDFLLNAGVGIWADGIDVSTDAGMRKITGRTGLFWPEAQAAMQTIDWRDEVEANRESMMDLGSWGVPTLRIGDFVVWGQDRIWLLARHVEDLCDSGDGILI
ncbi:MAG: DsbA family protein [Woeseiaceae bacterium]|nr:DsbA family protein [Woeseiaceae bacterium]